MMILIYGGSGSGKSVYAEELACQLEKGEICYLATMSAQDPESEDRIREHRFRRHDARFVTRERYLDLLNMELPKQKTVLLECLSNLTANELFRRDGTQGKTLRAVLKGVRRLRMHSEHLVVVSNQIFSDGKVYDYSTQQYMQSLATLNEFLAREADAVIEVVCGIPILQKGALPKSCAL